MDGNINAALILIDRAIEDLEGGFVSCKRCGDQEDTKGLDSIGDLKAAKKELLCFIERQEQLRAIQAEINQEFERVLLHNGI